MKRNLTPDERRERRRNAVQKSKFALPSAITLSSMLCGFSSVVMSINAAGEHTEWYFRLAAILLIAASVFDGFDGMVARATNTTSEFGGQLDSLADVLSFGMAPAILAYRYGFFQMGLTDHHLRAVGWAACFFFLACGALRLARFNVQVGHADPRFFVGMPIPSGAICVASVILWWPSSPTNPLYGYLFAAELFFVGLLMVSTIRFPGIKKLPHSPRAVLWSIVGFAFLLCLLVVFPTCFFLVFFVTYVLSAFLLNLAWLRGWHGIQPPAIDRRETSPAVEENLQ